MFFLVCFVAVVVGVVCYLLICLVMPSSANGRLAVSIGKYYSTYVEEYLVMGTLFSCKRGEIKIAA